MSASLAYAAMTCWPRRRPSRLPPDPPPIPTPRSPRAPAAPARPRRRSMTGLRPPSAHGSLRRFTVSARVPPAATTRRPEAAAPGAQTGTMRVKRGMADMLKGGVIMDVVTPEQAKIAEDAGAVAVMALERGPADIRVQGGVARRGDPDMTPPI